MAHPYRERLILAAALLSAAAGAWKVVAEAREPRPADVTRYASAHAILPVDGDVVGFVSDPPPHYLPAPGPDYAAQYALAPRLLAWHTDRRVGRWIVGQFKLPAEAHAFANRTGVRLTHDLGKGLYLFQK